MGGTCIFFRSEEERAEQGGIQAGMRGAHCYTDLNNWFEGTGNTNQVLFKLMDESKI